MLAIKTVLADSDEIPTLIFDEIDTGISGRTAQKVSEKLSYIAGSHQVICITHLPQIAAMADIHFEILKSASEGSTATTIERLGREKSIRELARLLGGAQITEAVLKNAHEMKDLADQTKSHGWKDKTRLKYAMQTHTNDRIIRKEAGHMMRKNRGLPEAGPGVLAVSHSRRVFVASCIPGSTRSDQYA